MKFKRKGFLFWTLTLALAACSGVSAPVQTVTPESPAAATAPVEAEVETDAFAATPEPATQAPQTAAAEQAGPSAPAGCTVVSQQATPGPTEQSLFPPPTEDDWVLGPETAHVTILEYSDFQ